MMLRRRRTWAWVVAVVAIVTGWMLIDRAALAALAAVAGDAAVKDEWREGDRGRFAALEGKPPPALEVKDWTNGEAVKVEDAKGKVVLLDFWATWCGPCIASIPKTNALQEKYRDQGLIIIGVCHPSGSEKMKDTAREKDIKYLIAADAEGKTIDAYKVDSYPDYCFIDRSGKVRIGDCANGQVEEAIKALLAEPAPTGAGAAE